MHRILLALALLAAGLQSAPAATLAGVTLPDNYTVAGQRLVLNGLGLRTLSVFEVKVYVAGLYLAQPSHDAAAILHSSTPKAIVLQFLHAGSKAAIEKQFRAGEAQNCAGGACDPADLKDFEALVAAAPAVAVGDTSTYLFTDGHVAVYANQTKIGDFANRDLAYHLLEGFIGAHPPSEELKAALLGNH